MLTMTCSRGCELDRTQKTYECTAKACNQNNLCEGCVYECADCTGDFCFDHVIDLNAKANPAARYVCLPCVAKICSNVEVAA